MSISSIKLENFKRFQSEQFSFTAPLSLIYGPNSSGKSSIIKSLLSLKQTFYGGNEHEAFAANGRYVNLGAYRDFVFGHDVNKDIVFEVTLMPPHAVHGAGSRLYDLLKLDENEKNVTAAFSFDHDYLTNQPRLVALTLKIHTGDGDNNGTLVIEKKKTRDSYWMVFDENLVEYLTSYVFGGKPPALDSTNRISVELVDKYDFKFSSDKERLKYGIVKYVAENLLSKISDSVVNGMFYLGPLRHTPMRAYIRSSHNLDVGAEGEHTASVFANLEARQKKVTQGESELKDAFKDICRWVGYVFPGCNVSSLINDELVKLFVSNKAIKMPDVVSDVGFGFSQCFPILVQLAVMQKHSVCVIEQPELHLHPKAQVGLAKVFYEAAAANKRLIVESHSEHLLRGLQLEVSRNRISKKHKLTNADVNIIYVPELPKKPFSIGLNQFGELDDEWPSGFFDEAYTLSMELLQNKAR